MNWFSRTLVRSCVLVCMQAFLLPVTAAPLSLKIQILEGEGASYTVGSRATRGITVLISDEIGRPVEGATVTFRLPDQSSSGVFTSGARTESVLTQADGKAAVWGMQWSRNPGKVDVQITAVQGDARAGTVCPLELLDGRISSSRGGHKWIWIVAGAVGGAAGAGVALRSHGSTAAAEAPTLKIGTPTIILGRP